MKVFFSALVARMHSVKNSQYLNHCLHHVCPFRPKTFNCWDYSLLNLSLSLQLWCSLQSNLYIEFFPTIRAPWFHGLTCRVELGSSTLRGIFCRIFSPGRQSAACPRSVKAGGPVIRVRRVGRMRRARRVGRVGRVRRVRHVKKSQVSVTHVSTIN